MKFSLVTPEQDVLSCEASHVVVPGEEGSFGVLDGHQPMVAAMVPGQVTVESGETSRSFFVGYGYADVSPERVVLLAEDAVAAEALDVAATRKQIDEVRGRLSSLSEDDPEADLMRKRLAVLEVRLGREGADGR